MMVSIVDQSYTDPQDKLKCLLFAKEEGKLPDVKLGHIIRFHRLAVSEFGGCLQGQSSPGFSWLLFSGDVGAPLMPQKSSSQSYTITDSDKQKVEELRRWASSKDELHEKLCTFSEVTAGSYFDLICQVVYTSVIQEGVGRLFKVWDGTQLPCASRDVGIDSQEQSVKKNDRLMHKARGVVYDVQVFDNHFKASQHIKPGDYVKFINLHAAEYTSPINRTPAQPTVECVLHRGDSFGRCVRVLPPDSPDLDAVKQRQEIVSVENESFDNGNDVVSESSDNGKRELAPTVTSGSSGGPGCQRDQERPSTSGEQGRQSTSRNQLPDAQSRAKQPSSRCQNQISKLEHAENVPDVNSDNLSVMKTSNTCSTADNAESTLSSRVKRFRRTVIEQTNDKLNADSDVNKELKCSRERTETAVPELDSVNDSSNSVPRCLLQTSTVILGHVHVKRSMISEVLAHEVPYKFRVRARVIDYHPKPTSVKSFIQLYCSTCHFLSGHPETEMNSKSPSGLQVGSTFRGVPHYNCPRCYEHRDSLPCMDSPPHLQYIYMMRLILQDDTGMLMANIWREEAVQFFQDVEPEQVLRNQSDFIHITDCLSQICPLDVAPDKRPWLECCIKSYSVTEGTGYQIFDTVVV